MSWVIDIHLFQDSRIKQQQFKAQLASIERLKFNVSQILSNFCRVISITMISSKIITLIIIVQNYLNGLDINFSINLNYQSHITTINSILLKNKLPLRIKNKQLSKIFVMETLRHNTIKTNEDAIVLVCLDNDTISFKLILPLLKDYKEMIKHIRQIILGNDLRKKIVNVIKKIFDNKQQKDSYQSQKSKDLSKIYKYFQRIAMQPTISIKSESNRQQTICKRRRQEVQDLQNLWKYRRQIQLINKKYFQTQILYRDSEDHFIDYNRQISVYEKQSINEMLYIPKYKNLNTKQNTYVFNHVVFQQNQYKKNKFQEGGKSQIFVFKASIIEVYSFDKTFQQQIKESSKLKQRFFVKYMVLKQDKKNKNTQSKNYKALEISKQYNFAKKQKIVDNKQLSRKLQTQIKIIAKMKQGSCAFLPKFYKNIQKNSIYQKYLLSQFIPSTNLRQFIKMHTCTMSFATKLYIVFQIVQSLRFISGYQIVHLDVKQSNFVIQNKLIIKLLDFQQSYHPQISGKHHKPNFSIPYGPPQVVTSSQGRCFNQKSDVYSLGILIRVFNKKYSINKQQAISNS